MISDKTQKIIKINPDLFSLKKTIKNNKKEKKSKNILPVQSNNVKRELLKIKDYQRTKK